MAEERRKGGATRRTWQDRRAADRFAGRREQIIMGLEETQGNTGVRLQSSAGSTTGSDIITTREVKIRPERRIGGAGRRSGDLSRALKTGESVIFDVSKMKPVAKKLAKKAGTIGKLGLAAVTLYDMVNKNKE